MVTDVTTVVTEPAVSVTTDRIAEFNVVREVVGVEVSIDRVPVASRSNVEMGVATVPVSGREAVIDSSALLGSGSMMEELDVLVKDVRSVINVGKLAVVMTRKSSEVA